MAELTAYLSLGANLGNASATIAAALARLQAAGARLVARSADYATPPWGKLDQPAFINVCAEVSTSLTSLELLRLCLATETGLGRTRAEKWGPRTIDIDILLYGNAVINAGELTVPHPRYRERRFVLEPLAELNPSLRDPVTGRSVAELLRDLRGQAVRRR